MPLIIAGLLLWLWRQVEARPWLLLVAAIVAILICYLGAKASPRRPRRKTPREEVKQTYLKEETAYHQAAAELRQTYERTRDQIRRTGGP